jgi:agmatine deiminase
MPKPLEDGGVRLPASYANFLIANEAVLLPVYNCRQDRDAVKILQEVLPKKEIIPIDCTAMVYGLGAIHCVSQQEPA